MSLDELFLEAKRQLTVCNSCRYCQGYCPVWPALELRTMLTDQDVTHLANLCHDCQDCFSACMYTAPHEFALNPPEVFAAVRSETYENYVWPTRTPRWASGHRGLAILTAAVVIVLLGLAALLHGSTKGEVSSSPYRLIPHWVLVGVILVPVVWGIAVTVAAIAKYWRDIDGQLRRLARPLVWSATILDGVRLRHMRGGGQECDYPTDEPSSARRHLHSVMLVGLLLCFVSTISAAVQEQFLGSDPPYALLSVPVVSGTLGGIGIIIGCGGLLVLKRRSDALLTTPRMRRADYGLLTCLLLLSVTGLLTLILRATPLFLPMLVIHLATILAAFAIAPYTKFVHFVFRLLSIYKNRLDQEAERAAA